MTLFHRCWPRVGLLRGIPVEVRLFAVSPDSLRLLGICHWQPAPKRQPTLILVHGLEGSSESHYMLGITRKVWAVKLVIRRSQRNCGGTQGLTPTLYNGGLSEDLRAVATELTIHDGIEAIWLAGYSMGGNLILRMAGEAGTDFQSLRGVVAVCPNIDPAACVDAWEENRERDVSPVLSQESGGATATKGPVLSRKVRSHGSLIDPDTSGVRRCLYCT